MWVVHVTLCVNVVLMRQVNRGLDRTMQTGGGVETMCGHVSQRLFPVGCTGRPSRPSIVTHLQVLLNNRATLPFREDFG